MSNSNGKMTLTYWANQEDSERGWDGTYLDQFIEWCEDRGIIANGSITKMDYDVLRREYDTHSIANLLD